MTLGLLRIAWKNLAFNRFRTVLTVLAVALGAAVVTATCTTNAAIEESLERSAHAMVGRADLLVEAVEEFGFPYDITAAALRRLPEAAVVAPQVKKRVFYRTQDQRGFVALAGVDPVVDPQVLPLRVTGGAWLSTPTAAEVVVGAEWAARVGAPLGGDIELLTNEGFRKFRVVGVVEETDPSLRGLAGLVRMPLQTAQEALGLENQADSYRIIVKQPGQAAAVKGALPGILPAAYVAKESTSLLAEFQASIQDFQIALAFFGGIALLAGAYLVYTTLALTVQEQVREIGLLRTAGAGVGFVTRLTLAQGAIVGVLGSAAGALLGQLLAWGLIAAVGATQDVGRTGLVFSLSGLAGGLVLGTLVTVGASLAPALQAGRVTPLAASNPRFGEGEADGDRGRDVAAVVAAAVLTAYLVFPWDAPVLRGLKLVGVFVLFFLFGVLARAAVPKLATLVMVPLQRVSWGVSTLADRNLRRLHARTATTSTAYFVSLAMVVALFNSAASFSGAAEERALTLFPGEYTVVSPVNQPLDLIDEFAGVPGVERVSPVTMLPVVWQNERLTVAGVDPSHYFQAFQFRHGDRIEGVRAMQRGDGVLVPLQLATDKNLRIGDKLPLAAGGRVVDFTISGIIAHSFPSATGYGAIVAPNAVLLSSFGVDTFRFLAVSLLPEADPLVTGPALLAAAEGLGMEAAPVAGLRASVNRGVNSLLGLLLGLVAVGVVVGILGILNTMVMSIGLRVREIALLRAAGMARAGIQALFLVEASIIGFQGSVLGVALGALITWVLVSVARAPDFDPTFSFSLPFAAAVIVFGIGGALLAAVYPARRAAAVNIIEAIRHRQ